MNKDQTITNSDIMQLATLIFLNVHAVAGQAWQTEILNQHAQNSIGTLKPELEQAKKEARSIFIYSFETSSTMPKIKHLFLQAVLFDVTWMLQAKRLKGVIANLQQGSASSSD